MLYGNSFINPVIYSICNDQFRTGFRDLFGSCLQPCTFLMKITGYAKSDPDRTLMRSPNDRLPLHDDIRDGRVLTNGYNGERDRENGVPRPRERADSACGGRCAERSRLHSVSFVEPSASKFDDIAYVSAV
jgi:hypothetical protein